MAIRIVGPVALPDGYGEMTRQLAIGMIQAGFDIEIRSILFGVNPQVNLILEDFSILKDFIVDEYNTGRIRSFKNEKKVDVCIQCLTADNFPIHRIEGALNVGYCMWEASRIPEHWIPLCNSMDLIVVPSIFCRRVFIDSGVTAPVCVVPIGCDVNKFDKIQRNPSLDEMFKDRYVFYSIFQWSERKNPEALLNAYYSTFGSDDKVLLVLKTYINDNDQFNKNEILFRVGKIRHNIKRNSTDYPHVMLVTDRTENKNIQQLHLQANCYLAPVRGEGWGIPIFDAALAGKHIIATADQSYCDFLNPFINDLIPYKFDFVHNMPSLYTPDQKWAEIDQEKFIDAMQKAYILKKPLEEEKSYIANDIKHLKSVYDRINTAKMFIEACNETLNSRGAPHCS